MRRLLALFALIAGLTAAPAAAQTGLGLNLQYGLDIDALELGVEGHFPFRPNVGLSFVPNFEYYFRDGNLNTYTFNADVHYAIGGAYTRSFTPYVGLGLAIARTSNDRTDASDTDAGLNLKGGATFRGDRFAPFVQLEFRAGAAEDLSIGGGVRFAI